MLAPAFRRDIDNGAFEKFQHSLLHSLPGNIPRYGRVVALAGYLVYLVHEDNALFRHCNVIIRILQQARKDIFHIFADISGLGKHRGVHNGERHIEQTGYCSGQQCLAGTCRADEKDIRFFDFDTLDIRYFTESPAGLFPVLTAALAFVVLYPFVMVVHGDGEQFFRPVLPYDILVEKIIDFLRTEKLQTFLLVYSRFRLFLLVRSGVGHAHVFQIIGSRINAIRTDKAGFALKQHGPVILGPATEKTAGKTAVAGICRFFSHIINQKKVTKNSRLPKLFLFNQNLVNHPVIEGLL